MDTRTAPQGTAMPTPRRTLIGMLGPAFVAAVAYVDPGNVAANITAGARYGYLLVWVLALANMMSVLIQYQSAKLGIVTGKSLPQLLGERMGDAGRFLFFAQAEVIAIATDLAELIGGAIALHLLFGLPLFIGGCIIGAVSTLLLRFQGGTHASTVRTDRHRPAAGHHARFRGRPVGRSAGSDRGRAGTAATVHNHRLGAHCHVDAGRDGDAARDLSALDAGQRPLR